MPKSTQKQALNQILYGSPGTGKTLQYYKQSYRNY